VSGQPPEGDTPEADEDEAEATETQPTEVAAQTAPPRPRRLERSRNDRVVAGVCGGLGEYFAIDAVLFRIAFVLLIFAGGLGILAYGLGWLLLPEEPWPGDPDPGSTLDRAADALGEDRRGGAVLLGGAFVGVGVLFLLDVAWPNFLSWRYVWPVALIAVGAAIILRARR
jgi:phage shock protein C